MNRTAWDASAGIAAGGGGTTGHVTFGFPGCGSQYGALPGMGPAPALPFPSFRLKTVLVVGVAPEPEAAGTLSICSKVDQIHCGLVGVLVTMWRPTRPMSRWLHVGFA